MSGSAYSRQDWNDYVPEILRSSSAQARRLRVLGGILFIAGYVLLAYYPPTAGLGTGTDHGLWSRTFPDVPAWWVLGRLASLITGIALLFPLVYDVFRIGPSDHEPYTESASSRPPARAPEIAAFALALVHLASLPLVPALGRWAEMAYILLLAGPSVLLGISPLMWNSRVLRRWSPNVAWFCFMPTLWLAWSALTAWRSFRAASVVDGWVGVERMQRVLSGDWSLLAYHAPGGYTNAYLFLEGLAFANPERPDLAFAWLRVSHCLWSVVCALAIGWIVRQRASDAAAIVGQAAFLFSPLVLSFPYNPLPIFLGPLCVSGLLLLFRRSCKTGSPAALAAFGTLAGFSIRIPLFAPITLLLFVFLASALLRSRDARPLVLGTAILSFAAAALPGLPGSAEVANLGKRFASGAWDYRTILLVLFGQLSPALTTAAMEGERHGWFEILLAGLLSPFIVTRDPLRLWADCIFEPISASLFGLGVALCAARLRRNREAFRLLLLVMLGLLPALVSAGDRVSHTRMVAAVVPIVVLVALTFDALRMRLMSGWSARRVGMGLACVIAASGTFIFHVINPRILPSSAVEIGLEAAGRGEATRQTVFLDHGGYPNYDWLYVREIVTNLSQGRIAVLRHDEFERSVFSLAVPPQHLYVWSPGLEQDRSLQQAICARWPSSILYVLFDRPRVFHAIAASLSGEPWEPAFPRERWSTRSCAEVAR